MDSDAGRAQHLKHQGDVRSNWEDQYGAVSTKRDLLSPAVKYGNVLLCFKRGELL